MILAVIKRVALILLCLTASAQVLAAIDHHTFEDENLRQRYLSLVKELRCPKCQNQNIADSNSPISNDLREQVYLQLKAGNSDQQIISYMVERYGQFIVYRPPLKGKTLILWMAPVMFLLIGLACIVFLVRRPTESNSVAVSNTGTSQRIKELLNEEEQS